MTDFRRRLADILGHRELGALTGQIIRGVTGTLGLRIASLVLGFLTSMLLARTLGASGYGIYAYALAWINLLFVPAMLGFNKLLVRETAVALSRESWGALNGISRWTLRTTLGLSIAAAVALVGVTQWLLPDVGPEKRTAIAVAAGLLPLLAVTGLYQAILRGLKYALIGQIPGFLVRPVLLIGFALALLYFSESGLTPVSAMTANLSAALIAFGLGTYWTLRYFPRAALTAQPEYHRRVWLGSAVPMLLLGVLQAANAQISLLILGMFEPDDAVGIFAIAVRISSLGTFVLLSFNLILAPHIATLYAEGNKKRLQRLVTLSSLAMSLLSLPVLLFFVIFGKPFLALFGPDYVNAYVPLVILSVGVFFNNTMGSVGLMLTMTGHEKDALNGIALGFAVNLIMNFILIPVWGAVGAAVANTVYLFFWNTLFAIFVYRRTGIVPSVLGRRTPTGL